MEEQQEEQFEINNDEVVVNMLLSLGNPKPKTNPKQKPKKKKTNKRKQMDNGSETPDLTLDDSTEKRQRTEVIPNQFPMTKEQCMIYLMKINKKYRMVLFNIINIIYKRYNQCVPPSKSTNTEPCIIGESVIDIFMSKPLSNRTYTFILYNSQILVGILEAIKRIDGINILSIEDGMHKILYRTTLTNNKVKDKYWHTFISTINFVRVVIKIGSYIAHTIIFMVRNNKTMQFINSTNYHFGTYLALYDNDMMGSGPYNDCQETSQNNKRQIYKNMMKKIVENKETIICPSILNDKMLDLFIENVIHKEKFMVLDKLIVNKMHWIDILYKIYSQQIYLSKYDIKVTNMVDKLSYKKYFPCVLDYNCSMLLEKGMLQCCLSGNKITNKSKYIRCDNCNCIMLWDNFMDHVFKVYNYGLHEDMNVIDDYCDNSCPICRDKPFKFGGFMNPTL